MSMTGCFIARARMAQAALLPACLLAPRPRVTMDAQRFDALIRLVSVPQPRRGLLFALAGLLAGSDVGSASAAKRKRCRPRCAVCERCTRKGQCKRKPDGETCRGKPCCECKGGLCAQRDDDTACNDTGRCLSGECNPRPTCLRAGQACSAPQECCSRECNGTACALSQPGERCRQDSDCAGSPGTCVGYRCR
jgi:hypothetical protein